MLIYLFIILYVIIFTVIFFSLPNGSYCIIDDSLFPELHLFKKFNKIIIKELDNAITSNQWIDISTMNNQVRTQYNKDPKNTQEIINIIKKSYEPLNTKLNYLKLFILVYLNHAIYENINICPNIMALVNGIPNVINAYIECIASNTISEKRYGIVQDSYRCLIPLTPFDDTQVIAINDIIYKYVDLLTTRNYIVFNASCPYQLWNLSNINHYVLIIYVKN